MRYLCTRCNYIYDESVGDKVEAIGGGTSVESLGGCPSCGEFDSFHEIKDEINYAGDENNLDFLEREHIPDFEIVDDTLKVFVGADEHPMGESHRITSVSIYDEYGDLVYEQFLEQDQKPEAEFDISDLDDFEIRVRCNLHGLRGKKVTQL